MKKVIAWLLVLALTAAISIGATLAYLTDTDEDVNVMTLGKVKIDQLEYERINDETKDEDAKVQDFRDNKPLYPAITDTGFDYTPGDTYVNWEQIGKGGYKSLIWDPAKINNEVDKMVFVKNKGDYDAFVRSVFAFEAGNYKTLDEFQKKVHLNLNTTDYSWEWLETPVAIPNETGGTTTTNYFIATATYNKVLAPGALTEISLSQIALDKTATNEDVKAFGDTYQVLVKSQGIQADGFDRPDAALDAGFGEITADNIPWENDSPTRGVSLKKALHYYEGGATKITGSVANVIFGKTADYPEVVNGDSGTLVDVEQDVPARAYYVSNGSTYDVYVLSDSTIYAPANCYELFYNGEAMASLKSVVLSNLNTSRTTNMARMFRNCTALTSLDISGLNTGAVTDMSYMIYNCSALKTVNATGLNTGNVTTMANMFRNCSALTDVVGAKGWNVSKVTDMNSMFRKCTALTTVDLAGWNTASLTTMPYIFRDCSKLVSADLSGWNMSNVTNMESLFDTCGALTTVITTGWDTSKVENLSYAFYDCGKLTTLDVSGWNTGSMKNLDQTFFGCKKLATLDVSGWDTQNVDFLYATFYNCSSLTTLDVSNWNTAKVTNMNCLFAKCSSLAELDVSGWDVGNVAVFSQTFAFCPSLTALDVSNWDTSSATAMDLMFYTDYNLEYLDVSNWDVSKVTKFNHIFATDHQNAGDMKLKNVDVSKWNPVNAVNMGSMFYGCGQLESVDMSGWNMPKLENLTHAFADCHSLKEVKLTGWNTPALISVDAMFNHCMALESIDVSDLDTATVREFSQMFEACTSLKEIIGMNKWDTSSGRTFTEMFNATNSLKVLDLSAWNTGSAYDNYKTYAGDSYPAFTITFTGMTSLEKLIIGENVSFRGNGTISEANQMSLPAPAAKAGFTAKWRNVETGELYDASEIPEKTAATYEAYYIANP